MAAVFCASTNLTSIHCDSLGPSHAIAYPKPNPILNGITNPNHALKLNKMYFLTYIHRKQRFRL